MVCAGTERRERSKAVKRLLAILFLLSLTASVSEGQVQSGGVGVVVRSGTLQDEAAANGSGTPLSVIGLSEAVITVNCATCSGGTVVGFEGSEDGSNYVPISGVKLGTTTTATSTTDAGVTLWKLSVSGLQLLRTPISSYSAGLITVTGHAQSVPGAALNSPAGTQPISGTVGVSGGVVVSNAATAPIPMHVTDISNVVVKPGDAATNSLRVIVPENGTAVCSGRTILSAASTNATNCKNAAGVLYGFTITNTNASPRFVKFYNKASAPVCGTDTPALTIAIPGNTSVGGHSANVPADGLAFPTGIGLCTTTGIGDGDTGAVAANELAISVFYR